MSLNINSYSQIDTSFDVMMNKCKQFAETYKPYYPGNDSFISYFRMPPDDIDSFLFKCLRNNNFEPLKYSAVIIFKQQIEYSEHNNTDFVLDNSSYRYNGFLEMIRVFMKREIFPGAYMAPLFTQDVSLWIIKNRNQIKDFDYVKRTLKITKWCDISLE